MGRLPNLTPETMTALQRRVHDAIASGPRGSVRGPFPALLHCPAAADHLQRLGEYLRFGSALPARAREVAILATSRHWKCQHEWHSHEPLALEAGVPAAPVAAMRGGEEPRFDDPTDRAVHEFAVALLKRGAVGERAYRAARDALGAAGVVELVVVVGYYTTLAMTLNAHEVPLPPGVAPPLAP